MKAQTITPIVTENNDETLTNHPAFGLVSVNRLHSSGTRLFASDLVHREVITMTFHEAEQLEQDGDIRYRRTRRNGPLLSVSLSPAQWAAMITSFGMGDGVPCTLKSIRTDGYVDLPHVGHVESTRERYDRQIQEAARRQLEKLNEKMAELGGLVAKGKASKRELAELYSGFSTVIDNMPGNLSFTTELIQESMDKIVASGKAELEATALGVATRLGMKEIGRLAALEDKSDEA